MNVLLAVFTAVCFACVGLAYAAAARRNLSMLPFVAISASVAACLSLPGVGRGDAPTSWTNSMPLIAWIGVAGLLGQCGMLLNGKAMQAFPRRTAPTWTLFQSAMVVPFLVATLSGRERAAGHHWLALTAILLAFVALVPRASAANGSPPHSALRRDFRGWAALLAGAFCCSGISQALMQEISLRGVPDPFHLRVPVSLGAGGVFLWVAALAGGQRPSLAHWRWGILNGVFVATGNTFMFAALDRFAADGRAYLVFPVAVGGTVILYAFVQLVSGRETADFRQLVGIALGAVGIVLLALRYARG